MKERRLFTLLLAICMVVSLIPTVAFANTGEAEAAVATQTSSPKTYTVDVTNSSHKVGVNGGTPVNSQIDSTGIILNPGDKLVWTSTGGKTKRLTGMMDHHGDDNYPYTYSTGVGFKIVKSNASENYKLSDACNIQEKAYKIISGGQTTFGNDGKINNATDKLIYDESKGEAPPTGLEAATVHVDDSMTANVPMLVKATNGGQPGVYYSYCSIHTTCTWNAYYYGVGHTFTVEPLTLNNNQASSIDVNLDGGSLTQGNYPTNTIKIGTDPATISIGTPAKNNYTFGGWDILDIDGNSYNNLFTETKNDDGTYTFSYPGLTTSNWNTARNAAGSTLIFKPRWISVNLILVNLDGNGGVVYEESNKDEAHFSVAGARFHTSSGLAYSAVRPGYDFLGWYLGDCKIEKLSDIPVSQWNASTKYTLVAKWKRNNDPEYFSWDPVNKKLTILSDSFLSSFDTTYYYLRKDDIEVLEVAGGIETINYDNQIAFYSNVKSIIFHDSITSLGKAINSCSSLKAVYIPDSVTAIDYSAFPNNITVYCNKGSNADTFLLSNSSKNCTISYLTYSTADGREATCTEDGYEGYKRCNECGAFSKSGKVIPATGHSWNDGEVTTAATETVPGTKTYRCKKCTAAKEEDIPATGHVWGTGVVTKAATATETGIKTYTCTGCHATTTEIIPVIGHEHSWNNGYVTKEPTETETGIKIYNCTGCSEIKQEVISATGESGGNQEPDPGESGSNTGGNDPSTGESSGNTGGLTGGTTAPSVPADNTITNSGSEAAGNSSTNVNLSDKTTVSGDKAEATVDSDLGNKIVENAVENKATEVVIKAETSKGDSTGASVTLPAETVQAIYEKTEATVTIETDSASISLDQDALAAVAAQAGTTGEVKLIVEIREQNKNKVEVDLKIVTDKGTVSDFNGGNVTVSVPVDKELAKKKLVCVYIDENGHMSKVKGQLNADGTFTFTTGHFSTYAILAEEEADAAIAEQKAAIKNIDIKLTSKQVKTKSGKKGIKITWTADAGDKTLDGIEIYRSTERYKGYGTKPFYATKNGKTEGYYINTKSLKAGTRYYYRVRGYVLVDGQKVYTDYSNKAWRTVK